MKKTLLLLALSMLFLSSCDMAQKPAEPYEFRLDTLPEIGEFSGIGAQESFFEGVSEDFIPRDDYGTVVPYIGSYRVFETPENESFHTEMGYASYGFCTTDGKIVMKASDKNTYISSRTTDDGFSFYTITREIMPKEDAPDEFVPNETLVIPHDGSWCLALPQSAWVTNCGGGFISVCDYPLEIDEGPVRTKMYNYDGELVRTLMGIDSVGKYRFGLLKIANWTEKDGYNVRFIDDRDNVVLGPYMNAGEMNGNGICAVTDARGSYLVNYKGEIVSDIYDSVIPEYSDENNIRLFCAKHKDDNKISDILDGEGKVVGTAAGSTYFSFRFPDNGEIFYYYTAYDLTEKGYPDYSTQKLTYKRLSDGSDFVSKEFGVSPNSYMGTDNCYVHIDKENKTGYFFDADGETIAVIENIDDVVSMSERGEYIVYTTGEYGYSFDEETGEERVNDTRVTYVYDSANKKVIYSLGLGASAYFPDEKGRFLLINAFESQDMFGGLTSGRILDTKTGEILFDNADHISVFNVGGKSYICACFKNYSSVYDENLTLINRIYFE